MGTHTRGVSPASQAAGWLALSSLLGVTADEYTHKYVVNEDVTLWVNKVGPYHNPQETYVYYSLPFCSTKPVDQLEHRWDALGEVLEGNDLISSGLRFRFQEAMSDSKICSMKLDEESSVMLQYAIRNHCKYLTITRPCATLPACMCVPSRLSRRRRRAAMVVP